MFFGLMNCHNRCDDAAYIAFKLKSAGGAIGGRATADTRHLRELSCSRVNSAVRHRISVLPRQSPATVTAHSTGQENR